MLNTSTSSAKTLTMNRIYLSIKILSLCIGITIFSIAANYLALKNNFPIFKNEPSLQKNMAESTSKTIKIPEKLAFCGEDVPLQNFDTRESLDRELIVNSYSESNTTLYLKRANRFFPLIESILKQNQVPEDFKYLLIAESGLAVATSSAGAKGYWQIMDATGKSYKMEINEFVDERNEIEKSTAVACKYLNESYKKLGSWTLAAASYNAGLKRIRSELDRQDVTNYYDLWINQETSRYIFRILAFKLIFENPKEYGFNLDKEDLYPVLKTKKVEVDSSVSDLIAFAKKYKTNYKVLKMLNPWLLDDNLPNKSKKKYTIIVPEDDARKVK